MKPSIGLRQFFPLIFSAVALAQGYPPASSSSPTSTDANASAATNIPDTGKTHTIKVGFPLGQHAFQPDYVQNVTRGDWIEFQFYPSNHSVSRMDPAAPCIPYEMSNHSESDSFWTGFYPVANPTKPESVRVRVKTEEPQWFYCTADQSCQKYQMLGVINPQNPADIAGVKKLASAAAFSVSPGERFPTESGQVPGAETPTPTAAPESSSLSGKSIAGIVIGSVAGLAILGLAFYFIKRWMDLKAAAAKGAAADSESQDPSKAAAINDHPPPVYQGADPRYSVLPPGSPGPIPAWADGSGKAGHQSVMSDGTGYDRSPHRLSELPSQNYDPVEIYTPGVADHADRPLEPPRPISDDAERRRDTVG